jgi:hypothetical protein
MFKIDKEDLTIYVTRGDAVVFAVNAKTSTGEKHEFLQGDIVRLTVYTKKKADNVVLQKDFLVTSNTTDVEIFLSKDETNIGEIISKPVDYWYDVVLNPDTYPQTIIGYNDDGARIFKLFPKGVKFPNEE